MVGNAHQHRVAPCPPKRIVDLVETVEIDERKSNDARAALGQRLVELLQHDAVIWQPGQGVLAGQLANRLGRAIERAREPVRRPRGEKGAQSERHSDRRGETPKPVHRVNERTVAHPTEPADDAAAAVDQRLHLASALARRVGIEPQTLEAGAPLDEAKLRIADPVDIAGHRVKLLDRLAQRHLPLDLQTAVVNLGDGKADAGANDHGACKHHQEERGDADDSRAFAVARGRNHRLARRPPACRPPVSGCRSGLHTHAPSETRRRETRRA